MKKLNKFAAALAAMVMALSFAGCSDNEEKDSGFDPSKVSVPKGSKELKSKEDIEGLTSDFLTGTWKITEGSMESYADGKKIAEEKDLSVLAENFYIPIDPEELSVEVPAEGVEELKEMLVELFANDIADDDDGDDDDDDYTWGGWLATSTNPDKISFYSWYKFTWSKEYWEKVLEEVNEESEQKFSSVKELRDYLSKLSDAELEELADNFDVDIENLKEFGCTESSGAYRVTLTKQS